MGQMNHRRHQHNHLTLLQAAERGMTLSEWCAHEQAEDALDAIETGRQERIIYILLSCVIVLGIIAAIAMGA